MADLSQYSTDELLRMRDDVRRAQPTSPFANAARAVGGATIRAALVPNLADPFGVKAKIVQASRAVATNPPPGTYPVVGGILGGVASGGDPLGVGLGAAAGQGVEELRKGPSNFQNFLQPVGRVVAMGGEAGLMQGAGNTIAAGVTGGLLKLPGVASTPLGRMTSIGAGGAAAGAAMNPAHPFLGAGIGGGLGLAGGGAAEAVGAGRRLFQKPPDFAGQEAMAHTEAQARATTDIAAAKQLEQQRLGTVSALATRAQTEEAIAKTSAQAHAASSSQELDVRAQQRLNQLSQEEAALHQALSQHAKENVLASRQPVLHAMARKSGEYQTLIDEGLAQFGDVPVPASDLRSFLQDRFSENPSRYQYAEEVLELRPSLPAPPLSQAEARLFSPQQLADQVRQPEEPQLSAQQLFNHIRQQRQSIALSARAGKRVYTPSEAASNDVASALVDYLSQRSGSQAFEKAQQMWAQWAPVRDQAIRDLKVFNQADTETSSGIKRLSRLAREKDPGNVEFLQQLQQEAGIDLTTDLKAIVSKMDVNQKERVGMELETKESKRQVAATQSRAMEDITQRFARRSQQLEQRKSLFTGASQQAQTEAQLTGSRAQEDIRQRFLAQRQQYESSDRVRRIIKEVGKDLLIATGGGYVARKLFR